MTVQDHIHYTRISQAIDYLHEHFKEQPSLEMIAEKVHLSPFHFQRLFTEWAGVSPKKFLQFISLEHAKKLLASHSTSILEASVETGLSGSSRLHDLFISIQGMTPGEYRNGGENLCINYSFAESPFGNILVASTTKGICHLAFADEETAALQALKNSFPQAEYRQITDLIQQDALHIFTLDWQQLREVRLHLKGSEFQLKVWEALLKIPVGHLSTYSGIAASIQAPKAARAVGSAVGDNPVAFLIPCHRVIQSSGSFGQYHWGTTRKTAIIGWESAKMIGKELPQ